MGIEETKYVKSGGDPSDYSPHAKCNNENFSTNTRFAYLPIFPAQILNHSKATTQSVIIHTHSHYSWWNIYREGLTLIIVPA